MRCDRKEEETVDIGWFDEKVVGLHILSTKHLYDTLQLFSSSAAVEHGYLRHEHHKLGQRP